MEKFLEEFPNLRRFYGRHLKFSQEEIEKHLESFFLIIVYCLEFALQECLKTLKGFLSIYVNVSEESLHLIEGDYLCTHVKKLKICWKYREKVKKINKNAILGYRYRNLQDIYTCTMGNF